MSHIIYDAPSVDWTVETLTTPQPRVLYMLPRTNSSIVYEIDYIVSPPGFSKMAVNSPYISSPLNSTLGEGGGSLTLEDAGSGEDSYGLDFPKSGKVKIGNEFIIYTSVDYATNELGGLTRGVDQGSETSEDAEHGSGSDVQFAAWLIEETNPQHQEGDLITFTRRFAMVPDGWTSFEMRPYTFPGYYNDVTETDYRAPLQEVVQWYVNHEYEFSTVPFADISVPGQAHEIKDNQGTIYEYVNLDTIPTYAQYAAGVAAGNVLQAADSTMDIYLGSGRIYHTATYFTTLK